MSALQQYECEFLSLQYPFRNISRITIVAKRLKLLSKSCQITCRTITYFRITDRHCNLKSSKQTQQKAQQQPSPVTQPIYHTSAPNFPRVPKLSPDFCNYPIFTENPLCPIFCQTPTSPLLPIIPYLLSRIPHGIFQRSQKYCACNSPCCTATRSFFPFIQSTYHRAPLTATFLLESLKFSTQRYPMIFFPLFPPHYREDSLCKRDPSARFLSACVKQHALRYEED